MFILFNIMYKTLYTSLYLLHRLWFSCSSVSYKSYMIYLIRLVFVFIICLIKYIIDN